MTWHNKTIHTQGNNKVAPYNGVCYYITVCKHTIIPIASCILIKAQDTMTFAYDITVCIHNKISTASNIMFKAHATMAFDCDIMVCIYNIISTASNIMMKSQDITRS